MAWARAFTGPGRYVFSADVGRALHDINGNVPLKFMPNEDATFGFWVMGMDLRHVDHPLCVPRPAPLPPDCLIPHGTLPPPVRTLAPPAPLLPD